MIGTSEEFKQYLESVGKSINESRIFSLHGVMDDLHCALLWELHTLPEVSAVTERLNDYLQSGGVFALNRNYELLEKITPSADALKKRLAEHQHEYVDAMGEQLVLLSGMYKTLKLVANSVFDVPKLLQLEETFARLEEDYQFRLRGTDHRHDWRKSNLDRLEEANAFYRKLLNAEEKKAKPTVTTIRNRRNIIVADFSALTLYIDVGGEKFNDSEAVIIAGFCYGALFSPKDKPTINPVTTEVVRNLSVCFKHTGAGQGEVVYQEEANAKTIKSFEDTLYSKPNTNQS